MPWVSDVWANIEDGSVTLYSPAPRVGVLCLVLVPAACAVIVLVRTFGTGPHIAVAALALGALALALTVCIKSFRTRFDQAAGDVTVETRSICAHSVERYAFAEVDALAAGETNVVELQLRDGTTRRLSYAHETYPQLDKMIGAVCAATGIAKGNPNVARAAFQDDEGVLSAPGMGLYVEGRFAILATSSKFLSFRRLMEIVFNRERREMTVIRTTPLHRSRTVIPLHAVVSIGLDGRQDRDGGAYSYRAVIRLDNGRSIRLFGMTRGYQRYDRILAKLRAFTGIAKEDNLRRAREARVGR